MSTKKPAATAATNKTTTTAPPPAAKPKKERTPRKPMLSMVQRLRLLQAIEGASRTSSDVDLARELSEQLGHPVAAQTVAAYRQELGIGSVKAPTRQQLIAHIDALRAQVTELGYEPVGMPPPATPAANEAMSEPPPDAGLGQGLPSGDAIG